MLLGLGKTLTFGQKIYPYATGGDYVYLYEEDGKTYRVHEFHTNGTFTVANGGNMDCLIVAGGGGGGGGGSNTACPGGGGAGGVIVLSQQSIESDTYSIVIGNGGTGGPANVNTPYAMWGGDGSNTTFNGYTAIGGGGGVGPGGVYSLPVVGRNGGSGGGVTVVWIGSSYKMDVTSGTTGQGNSGGRPPSAGTTILGGGGGGAGEAGRFGSSESFTYTSGVDFDSGGDGIEWPPGSGNYYGGGGGAGGYSSLNTVPKGGLGGGGDGGIGGVNNSTANGVDGTPNTGGGGGGGASKSGGSTATMGTGGDGGSGIVIVRYVIAEKTLWTPEEIKSSSMIVWTDNTVLSGSDGDLISSWSDKGLSSNNLNVRNPTIWEGTLDDKKPRFKNNIKNSLGGLEFTKTGGTSRTYADILNTDSSFDQSSPNFSKYCQIYLVCSVENLYLWNGASYTIGTMFAAPGQHYIQFDNYDSVNQTYRVKVNYRGYSGAGDYFLTPSSNTIVKNRAEIISVQKSSNTTSGHNLFHNGTSLASGNGTKDMTIATTIGLGTINFNYPTIVSGEIMEFLYFSESHDTKTRQKLEGYLAHKWGLTNNLPSGHPYKYEPPYKEEPEEIIVTDGLVLNLDAGDYASYPKSGTIWYDISGNGNDITLTNGPTYDSANNGSIVFDGSDDYADFFAPSLGNTTTVEMWVKLGASYSDKMFFGWSRYDVWCGSGHLGFNTGAGDVHGISSATVSSLGLVGNWKHYVFEMRSDASYTNNKIYINGNSQTLSQQRGSELSGNRNFNSGNGRISGWRYNTGYRIPMNCSVFRVYNRALSSTEIQQNYDALKGRYGL